MPIQYSKPLVTGIGDCTPDGPGKVDLATRLPREQTLRQAQSPYFAPEHQTFLQALCTAQSLPFGVQPICLQEMLHPASTVFEQLQRRLNVVAEPGLMLQARSAREK